MKAIAFLIVFLSLASSAQAVCPPAPVSSGHDTVIQLKASGGVAGIGPAANLVSNTQGTLIFDTSANTVKFCDGTNWVSLGGGGGGGGDSIPTGAVMAFDLASCPTGWSEYTASRGRFLRGIDNGAGNDPAGTRAPGNVQADELGSHLHSVDPPSTATSSAGAHTHNVGIGTLAIAGTNPRGQSGNTSSHVTSSAGAHTHTVNIPAFNSAATGGAETRPKNVAVLFCRKS